MKNIFKSFGAITLASFGIACVTNSDLGAFALTAAAKAFTNWTGITFALTYILLELIMLLWATYKGEGIGWTAIINGFYGPLVIAYFHHVLPHNPWLVLLGMPLIGIAYSMQGKAGLGDTGSCLFTTTLMKQTGWGVLTCRLILDTTLMIIGFIGARKYVTFGTILLTITTGPGLHFAYKVLKYKPTKIEHKYLIQLKK